MGRCPGRWEPRNITVTLSVAAYSSALGKGFPSASATTLGKTSPVLKLGSVLAKLSRPTTNLTQGIYWEAGWLLEGEKQQETELESNPVCVGGFPGRLGADGFQ